MSPDLRDALADLATEAPALDVADRAIARGRARRRHHVLGALAVAATVAIAAPLVASTVGDRQSAPPTRPPSSGVAYAPDLGMWQWPWTTTRLPNTLDEPVLMAFDGMSGGNVATVSGRLWSLGPGSAPSVSHDGWSLAWWEGEQQELVIRDLTAGTEQRLAAGRATAFDGVVIDTDVPLRWSPAGEAVAVTGTSGQVTVVDAETGEVVEITTVSGVVAGWLDDDRLLIVGPTIETRQDLSEVTLSGSVTSLGSIQVLPPDVDVVPTLSPDGRELAWYGLESEFGSSLHYWDLELGPRGSVSCSCIPVHAPAWLPDGQVLVESTSPPRPQVFGTIGEVEFLPLIAVSPGVESSGISIALDIAAAGPSGEPHTSRWWLGWYLDWITYAMLALLVVVVWRKINARRRRSPAGQ